MKNALQNIKSSFPNTARIHFDFIEKFRLIIGQVKRKLLLKSLLFLIFLSVSVAELYAQRIKNVEWEGRTIEVFADQVMVKINPVISVTEFNRQAIQYSIKTDYPVVPGDFNNVQIDPNKNFLEQVENLKKSGLFVDVWPNGVVRGLKEPNDPLYYDAPAEFSSEPDSQYHFRVIEAPKAWGITTGSSNVVIGVVDSGIALEEEDAPTIPSILSHEDWESSQRITLGGNYSEDDPDEGVRDLQGHGTAVAGVVGVETDNELGVAGTCWSCSLYIVKVLDNGNTAKKDSTLKAVKDAVDYGVDIINYSIGSGSYNPTDSLLVAYADSADVLFVASSGNGSSEGLHYPAALTDTFSNLIAVGATRYTNDDERWVQSNYGSDLSISAPGTYVWTTTPDYQVNILTELDYDMKWGTSLSAPQVVGTAGLILSINPSLLPSQIRDIFEATADKVGGYDYDWNQQQPGHSKELGYGRLNSYEALIYTIENYGATWSGSGYTVTIPAGTELNLQEDLYVGAGVTLVIEPDVTINFMDDDVKIDIDGTLLIDGNHIDDRIIIDGSGYTGNEINANAGATVKYADFTSVELNVSGSGENATIWNSKFLDSDGHGVVLDGLDILSFRNNYIDDASLFGLYLLNSYDYYSNIHDNTITNSQRGIYVSNSDVESPFYENVMEDNTMSGIQVVFGSDAWLVNEDEENAWNRYKDNGNNQVSISSNSKARLSDSEYSENTVYHSDYVSDPWEFDSEFIVNDNSSYTVDATYTFWGTSSAPLSSVFEGNVNYSNHLSSDQTGSSGSPYAKMVGSQEESKPAERTRKEKVLELISELEEDAYQSKNDHRLSELYMQLRRDRQDEMGLRDQILATIEEWSSRRTEISSTYEDSQEVRRAVETAMLLQVRLAIRSNDYALAKQRNDAFEPYVQLAENRLALVDNQTLIHIHNKDYQAALQTLEEARTLAQSLPLNDKDSWDVMERYVREKMGQEVDNPEKDIAESNRQTEEKKPEAFALKASYPNPFNPSTIIPFELPDHSRVRMEIYDILGRSVALLSDQTWEAGRHELVWDATNASSGVYIVQMVISTETGLKWKFNRQLTLMK